MKIIRIILVLTFMNVMTSVVCAQTPKNDVTKLSVDDVVMLKEAVVSNEYLDTKDSITVLSLLNNENIPQRGTVKKKGEIVAQSQVGDEFTVYISDERGSFWLSYVVTNRKKEFVGRIDTRIR